MKSTTHVNFHAYHTQLKCVGLAVLSLCEIPVCTYNKKSQLNKFNLFNYYFIFCSIQGCKLNSDGSNILPDLPSEFECNWKNCNDRFECMQYYAYHVAQHLEVTEFKNSNFICPWTGL